jgi:hypothetical protein
MLYKVMQSVAKHLAWCSNLYRSQMSAGEMLRYALHDKYDSGSLLLDMEEHLHRRHEEVYSDG